MRTEGYAANYRARRDEVPDDPRGRASEPCGGRSVDLRRSWTRALPARARAGGDSGHRHISHRLTRRSPSGGADAFLSSRSILSSSSRRYETCWARAPTCVPGTRSVSDRLSSGSAPSRQRARWRASSAMGSTSSWGVPVRGRRSLLSSTSSTTRRPSVRHSISRRFRSHLRRSSVTVSRSDSSTSLVGTSVIYEDLGQVLNGDGLRRRVDQAVVELTPGATSGSHGDRQLQGAPGLRSR